MLFIFDFDLIKFNLISIIILIFIDIRDIK